MPFCSTWRALWWVPFAANRSFFVWWLHWMEWQCLESWWDRSYSCKLRDRLQCRLSPRYFDKLLEYGTERDCVGGFSKVSKVKVWKLGSCMARVRCLWRWESGLHRLCWWMQVCKIWRKCNQVVVNAWCTKSWSHHVWGLRWKMILAFKDHKCLLSHVLPVRKTCKIRGSWDRRPTRPIWMSRWNLIRELCASDHLTPAFHVKSRQDVRVQVHKSERNVEV